VLGQPEGLAEASIYAFWALALVAVAGAFTPAAQRLPAFVWAIPPLLILSVVFTAGAARYRVPVEPILILFAAAAIDSALGRRARDRDQLVEQVHVDRSGELAERA
jgi:hypothetical protein